MPPGAIKPESNAPVSEVTECATAPRFVQQTVVPGVTFKGVWMNWKS
jgi:hypothetical protein